MKNRVLAFFRDRDEVAKKLRKLSLPDCEYFFHTEYDLENELSDINIFFGVPALAKKFINNATNLKWFQSSFAGIDSLVDPSLRQDYMLTNVKDAYGDVMAEYVLAYILMYEKEIIEYIDWQKEKEWKQHAFTSVLGKKVGVLGTGSIGEVIASKLELLGFNVVGLNTSGNHVNGFTKVYSSKNINSFVSELDYLVNVLPATQATKNIINLNLFKEMKPSSVFINVGRGSTVNEDDLIKALNKNLIKSAVLDVFKEEPLRKDNQLWDVPNLYITPHVSGYIISDIIFDIFESNYKKFINGESLDYKVDFNKGY